MQLTEEEQEFLDKVKQAVEQGQGDPQKEIRLLQDIVDPQDNLNCEGCQ